MKIYIQRSVLAVMIALLSGTLFAQHNEEVTVEGTYRPKVNKVDKIRLLPERPKLLYVFPSTEVQPKESDRRFDLDLEKLSPAVYTNPKANAIQPVENFLMTGLGTRLSPLFLYRHNSRIAKDVDLGVGLKHFSSWLNMKDFARSGFMNNAFDVAVGAKLSNYQLDGRVYYDNDVYHYYGYRLSDSLIPEGRIDELCPRQVYNTIGVNASLNSTDRHLQTLQHSVDVGYRYTFDKFGAKEHYAEVKGKLAYSDNWWGDRSKPQTAGLDLGLAYDKYDIGEEFSGRTLLNLSPYFEMKDDFYRLHLGFRAELTSFDSVRFSIRPDIKGSLYVFEKKVEFYAGLGGGKQIYSYGDIIANNPFVQSLMPLYFRNEKFAFEAGMRANILNRAELHFGVRYKRVDDDLFFVQSRDCPASIYNVYNTFTVAYDRTDCVNVLIDARYQIMDRLGAEADFAYNICTPTTLTYAWYRPKVEGGLKLHYDFSEQLSFKASMMYKGGRYALVNKGYGIFEEEKMKDVFDLGLGADYKWDDRLVIFAEIDNLTNRKYQLYYNYPVTGLQLFAGIKLKF